MSPSGGVSGGASGAAAAASGAASAGASDAPTAGASGAGSAGASGAATAGASGAASTGARRSGSGLARAAAEAWESLFRAQVALMRRFDADDIWGDLSMREYDVLFTLSRCDGAALRMVELNEHILLSQPSLSRMVDRLVERGLVAREPAVGDRRGVLVRLTAAGVGAQRQIGRLHTATIARYVGGALDAQELATLQRLTDKLRHAQTGIPR
jgi:DNA-binding MarR family transcriptional regulator